MVCLTNCIVIEKIVDQIALCHIVLFFRVHVDILKFGFYVAQLLF